MRPRNSTEVITTIFAIQNSLRTKLHRLHGEFNNPVLLARLIRQTEQLSKKCLGWCEAVDTIEVYDSLRELALLVSDFYLASYSQNAVVSERLHLLALGLHRAVRFNRRRISAGHRKVILV